MLGIGDFTKTIRDNYMLHVQLQAYGYKNVTLNTQSDDFAQRHWGMMGAMGKFILKLPPCL